MKGVRWSCCTKLCHIILLHAYTVPPLVQRAWQQCVSGSEWSRQPIQTCTEPKKRYLDVSTEFVMKGVRWHCRTKHVIYYYSLYIMKCPPRSQGHGSVVQSLHAQGSLHKLAQILRIGMWMYLPSLASRGSGGIAIQSYAIYYYSMYIQCPPGPKGIAVWVRFGMVKAAYTKLHRA